MSPLAALLSLLLEITTAHRIWEVSEILHMVVRGMGSRARPPVFESQLFWHHGKVLSDPYVSIFLICEMGIVISPYFLGLLWRLYGLIHQNCLENFLEHSELKKIVASGFLFPLLPLFNCFIIFITIIFVIIFIFRGEWKLNNAKIPQE